MSEIIRESSPAARETELTFHPLADMFPLMEGEEFDGLVADIDAHGQREPIILYEGMILDGRNRYRACREIALSPWTAKFEHIASTNDNAEAYVISKNIHRRHLTTEKKRELLTKLIKAHPEKSDRQIAKTAKVSPTTVGTVRTEMGVAGDVSKLDTRTDSQGRRQPAHRADRVRKLRCLEDRSNAKGFHRCHKDGRAEYDEKETAEAKRLADALITLDLERARELNRFLYEGGTSRFMEALDDALRAMPTGGGPAIEAKPSEGNGVDAGAAAEAMKARFAAMDAGADCGPIPECLRRAP